MLTIIFAVVGTLLWFWGSTICGRKTPSVYSFWTNKKICGDYVLADAIRTYKYGDLLVGLGVIFIILSVLYNMIASPIILVLIFTCVFLVWWNIRTIYFISRYWEEIRFFEENSTKVNKATMTIVPAGMEEYEGFIYKSKIKLYLDVFMCKNLWKKKK